MRELCRNVVNCNDTSKILARIVISPHKAIHDHFRRLYTTGLAAHSPNHIVIMNHDDTEGISCDGPG